jgi:prepilin-type N-terminal cleavage/methylation domain-containing protein
MTFLRARRGFSLLELMIALSILIIMTGAASYYLGDILFKAKIAKVKNDMETISGAVILHDAELPTELIDTGLIGTSATGAIGGTFASAVERQTVANLVGTYLLTNPRDPWAIDYKLNSYAGYVKSYASDYAIAGTTKYDKDIVTYYLPENLFLSKVRASDLNDNSVLDTGDEVILYFSKSVRCNVALDGIVSNAAVLPYTGVAEAGICTPYFIEVIDVITDKDLGGSAAEEAKHDGNGVNGITAGGAGDETHTGAAGADTLVAGWTAHDLRAFRPGGQDAGIPAVQVMSITDLERGEAGGLEGDLRVPDANGINPRMSYGFHRPADQAFYASCFSRELKFWCNGTSVSHGGNNVNLDLGYEIYFPSVGMTGAQIAASETGYDAQINEAYAIWESTKGYMAYKTVGEKKKIYMLEQDEAASKRTLVWKTIVD